MNFIKQLNEKLDNYHLLKHPFYEAWNDGALSIPTLQLYATEYYHHVAAFPRYISAIHSKCSDIKMRQILLGNLVEEEQGQENHPELWKRFAEGLGVERAVIDSTNKPVLKETRDLVDGYFDLTDEGFATGLGALYAYERQTPEVSISKIKGLKKFYGISDERGLKFFEVHSEADKWHSDECSGLLESLSKSDRAHAERGAELGAKLLWRFLDGVQNAAIS